MRGTVCGLLFTPAYMGITPACAGNRLGCKRVTINLRDHPRVCGEQAFGVGPPGRHFGSPPRVRGTDTVKGGSVAEIGITPACAGNSHRAAGTGKLAQDHPRVCGEQGGLFMRRDTGEGSPPRVRGTGLWTGSRRDCARITPACAGNRLKKARHFYILFCQIKRIHLV